MHISKLPSGTWRVAVKVAGRRLTGTAATRREAERVGARLLLSMGGHITSTATIGDLVAADVESSDWSPTYRQAVLAVVDAMPDDLAALPVRSIAPHMMAKWYRRLAAEGWAPHKIRRLHAVLAAAFAAAVTDGTLETNPIRNVPRPSVPARELVIPTDDDVYAILVAHPQPIARLALRLAATLGARRGEVVALQWRDVDLDRETVVVRRSLTWTKADGLTVGATKTGETGHRVLDVDPVTVEMLRDALRTQAAQGADKPGPAVPPLWVVSDDAGLEPWLPDRLSHAFIDARRRAGVHGVRLHDLRHYVATSMLQDGEAPIDVASQLGHSNTSTTLMVYAHYLPGRGRESARKRAARLDRR